MVGLSGLAFVLAACGGSPQTAPTPIVIVVTATPAPTTAATGGQAAVATAALGATPTAAATAALAATPAVAATPVTGATPGATGTATTSSVLNAVTVNCTNHYRGADVTVQQVELAPSIGQDTPNTTGDLLLGVSVRVSNPNTVSLDNFCGWRLSDAARLERADGSVIKQTQTEGDLFDTCGFAPGQSASGWLLYDVPGLLPLNPLKLVIGQSNETPAVIPFSGPEQELKPRTWSAQHSSDAVEGLIWSTSGGTISVSMPDQQANPNQEFIILNVRVTNTSPQEVDLPDDMKSILRLRTDNGVLLEPSAEINPLLQCCSGVPPQSQHDGTYAWQVPVGQQNPTLLIRYDRQGDTVQLPIGPLPPPATSS